MNMEGLSDAEYLEYKKIILQPPINRTSSENKTKDEIISQLKLDCIKIDNLRDRRKDLHSRLTETDKERMRNDHDLQEWFKSWEFIFDR